MAAAAKADMAPRREAWISALASALQTTAMGLAATFWEDLASTDLPTMWTRAEREEAAMAIVWVGGEGGWVVCVWVGCGSVAAKLGRLSTGDGGNFPSANFFPSNGVAPIHDRDPPASNGMRPMAIRSPSRSRSHPKTLNPSKLPQVEGKEHPATRQGGAICHHSHDPYDPQVAGDLE
eukprot:1190658-Prorocentrum_minimum.AAC.3